MHHCIFFLHMFVELLLCCLYISFGCISFFLLVCFIIFYCYLPNLIGLHLYFWIFIDALWIISFIHKMFLIKKKEFCKLQRYFLFFYHFFFLTYFLFVQSSSEDRMHTLITNYWPSPISLNQDTPRAWRITPQKIVNWVGESSSWSVFVLSRLGGGVLYIVTCCYTIVLNK